MLLGALALVCACTSGEETKDLGNDNYACVFEGLDSLSKVSIPDGVKVVHPYAFSARFHYERVSIPQSVEEIGAFAFNRCFDLCRTYVFAEEPPQIDPSAIDDLDLSLRYLYVPKGSASKYKGAPGWKKYKSRIVEFDAETEGIADDIADMPVEADVYAVDGRKVRYAHEGLKGLRPGVYVVGGKKLMVR